MQFFVEIQDLKSFRSSTYLFRVKLSRTFDEESTFKGLFMNSSLQSRTVSSADSEDTKHIGVMQNGNLYIKCCLT